MSDLFEGEAPAKKAEDIDWYTEFARKHRGVPEGWRWFRVETLNFQAPREQQTVLAEGGVPGVVTKGKRAGRPNWKARDKSLDRTISFSFAEIEQFQKDWEAETGKCAECYGTGERRIGWSAETGAMFEPCRKCGASGISRARMATVEIGGVPN